MLSKRGHEVIYISCPFHPLYKIRKWGQVDWQEGDIHIYAYSQLFFPQRFNVRWDSFKKKKWEMLLNIVERDHGIPDVIHLHYPTMITVPNPILAYKKKGVRIVATEHWTSVLTGKITERAKIQLKTYVEEADHFICVGKPLKESVVRLTSTVKEISIIPNIVPETFYAEKEKHEGVRFVAVGRLVKVKQFDKLIEAFANVFSAEKDVSLTIIGGGSQYERLKRQIKRKAPKGNIRLLGAQPRMEVAAMMAGSDAVISYSRLETFGVPIIEGWYNGIPAIATTAIGFAEYWDEFLGELIPFDDENVLENTLKTVKDKIKSGYYVPQRITEYAQQYFSEEAVYKRLVELYQIRKEYRNESEKI